MLLLDLTGGLDVIEALAVRAGLLVGLVVPRVDSGGRNAKVPSVYCVVVQDSR